MIPAAAAGLRIEAMSFYASVFKRSKVGAVHRMPI